MFAYGCVFKEKLKQSNYPLARFLYEISYAFFENLLATPATTIIVSTFLKVTILLSGSDPEFRLREEHFHFYGEWMKTKKRLFIAKKKINNESSTRKLPVQF